MNGVYLIALAMTVLACTVSAGFAAASAPHRRSSLIGALYPVAMGWWALCELMWNSSGSPDTASTWMHLSLLGGFTACAVVPHHAWCQLCESSHLGLHAERDWMRRITTMGYGCLALMLLALALEWTIEGRSGLIMSAPIATSWGWSYVPGPLFCAASLLGSYTASRSFVALSRLLRQDLSEAERKQLPIVWTVLLMPALAIAITEFTLPLLGVTFPRLGTISFAVFAALSIRVAVKYGRFILAARSFSEEILSSIGDGVVLLGGQHRIRQLNRGILTLSGHTRDALMGRKVDDLFEDDWKPLLESADSEMQTMLLTADGAERPVSLTASTLHDKQQNVVGVVLAIHDLRELEALKRQMLTHARLAAVGELSGGVAHEINNPLAFIRANLALLEKHWRSVCTGLATRSAARGDAEPLDEQMMTPIMREGFDLISESQEGVDRISGIVQGIRKITSVGAAPRGPLSVEALVRDAIKSIPATIGLGVEVSLTGEHPPSIVGSRDELHRAFAQLVRNAAEAMQDDHEPGGIRIEVRSLGQYVEIDFIDEGHGMEAATLERIFDPFFTTREPADGTGLGLAIAHQIIRAHGGTIGVHSSIGLGTTFTVKLPAAESDGLAGSGAEADHALLREGGEELARE